MTTIVGIKAEKEKPAVIIASDLSRTYTKWNAQGDVAYKQQTKSEAQKIYVDSKRNAALSMSGVYDELYKNFLYDFIRGRIEIKKAVKEGFFNDLKQLNEKRWVGRTPENDFMNSLIIATRFDKPKLYSCWPLGKIEEKSCLTLGSGSEYASDYIFRQNKFIPQGLSLEEGIRLAVSSLEAASQDIYTGGLDLVIITQDGIKEYGDEIKNTIKSAKDSTINKIIGELK